MSLLFREYMDIGDASQLNALQLAYLGDAVWELIVRYDLMIRRFNVHHMHRECVGSVNAGAQAEILRAIQDKLTEAESEIVRRGRNAHPKHASPKNQDPEDYSAATGFEALFGYLYLTGQQERILEMIKYIKEVKMDV